MESSFGIVKRWVGYKNVKSFQAGFLLPHIIGTVVIDSIFWMWVSF